MTVEEMGTAPHEGDSAEPEAELPSFPMRLVNTFFSPGSLTEALAKKPLWGLAMVAGAVMVLAQTALIPMEVWEASFREAILAQGQEVPAGFEAGGMFMRISAVVMGTIMYAIMTFLFAGVITLVFAFILGDEGKYRQYLAVLAHAWLIPAVLGFLLVPLRIAQGDPQLTLNLGTFLFFLPDGYLYRVAKMMDLGQLWAWLVVAQGAHAIDGKRTFGSATTVVIAMFVVIALLFGLIPTPG